MVSEESVVLVPGAIRDVRGYESYDGLDIWMNNLRLVMIGIKMWQK
ncbi:MAG: hypothetical protein ACD_11C00145G0020 [uncultured bacterium]|nr:MAG: hypothetical protein ACD_11C00145G0020 [uncultured bacterium]